ncbi:hypothetical protein OIO90_005545 [Microbotryomycetes sp. JL221]|nr:hypothetical protein OIO90_005545 [Microbotryomycetes sp. JL221]
MDAVSRATHAVRNMLWTPIHQRGMTIVDSAWHAIGGRDRTAAPATEAVQRALVQRQSRGAAASAHHHPQLVEAPSALSFLTSSFFCGIVALSIIANRIQAVVPPRRALHQQPSPSACRALRLPSLLLLARVVLLLLVTLATCRGYDPMSNWLGVKPLANILTWSTTWAGKSTLGQLASHSSSTFVEPNQICWETFLAVSFGSITEIFMRALLDELGTSPEFNLLGFSFLLHVASAISSSDKDLPPPVDLYIHLLIVTCEMFCLHLSFAFTPPLPRLRLAITGFWNITSQLVAIRGLLRIWNFSNEMSQPYQNRDQTSGLEASAGRVAWQSMLWSASIPQLTIEALSLLTITFRLLSAILRREELSVSNILGHESHFPRANEDFALAMVRYGGACLSQTRLAGLANEVSPLRVLAPAPLALIGLRLPPAPEEQTPVPYIELGRIGQGLEDIRVKWRGVENGRVPLGTSGGFALEIKEIEARGRHDIDGRGPRTTRRGRELWKISTLLMRIAFFLVYKAYKIVMNQIARVKRHVGLSTDEERLAHEWKSHDELEDDVDEDWTPAQEHDDEVARSDSASSTASSDDDDDDDDDDFDAATLLQALRDDPESTSLAPVLVAHHVSNGSPLTRRRYRALSTSQAQQPTTSHALTTAIDERRTELRKRALEQGFGDDDKWQQERRTVVDEGRQRFCVAA